MSAKAPRRKAPTAKERNLFKRLDNIGAADAEDDSFLDPCFVDNGDLHVLSDTHDPRRIVLAGTGGGKTALLLRLHDTRERVIRVRPESLALAYITNSTILNFIGQLGVKLDIFFRLLWRHVFVVELLRRHFKIDSENAKASWLDKLESAFRRKHRRALDYLDHWGRSFWEETEPRIKEVTSKLEREVKASVEASVPGISMTADGARKLTEEQKSEVIQRAQTVVNNVQIRELSEILDLLAEILNDPQKPYFITIDRLDEDWIEDRHRYLLIRALVETVRDFNKVRNAKIIIALRRDLLDRVFRLTRDPGFQEEKYQSIYLPVGWTPERLRNLLDQRVSHLFKERYTNRTVLAKDVLPPEIDGINTIEYLMERTLMRPRDLINFFNVVIAESADRPGITVDAIRKAEGEYSRLRLRALADEWRADYPGLMAFVNILKGRRSHFPLTDVTNNDIADVCTTFLTSGDAKQMADPVAAAAQQVVETSLSPQDFRRKLFEVFYRIGLAGLKVEKHEGYRFSSGGVRSVSTAEIGDDARVSIHPAFHRTLGINSRTAAEAREES